MSSLLEPALFVAGAALVLLSLYDLTVTTISISGSSGPVTSRVAESLWRAGLAVGRLKSTALLRMSGPVLLVLVFLTWLTMAAVGWALIFSTEGALTAPGEDTSTRILDPLFFTFSTMLGRGGGRLNPADPFWSGLEGVMALTGVAMITLALAWVLPVVRATVEKRHIAAMIATLGASPSDVLLRAWDGKGFGDLDLHLVALVPSLSSLAQHHLAYPAVHYFHSADARTAIGVRLAVLDDALTLLEQVDVDDKANHPSVIGPLRTTITDYLTTLRLAFIRPADEVPPPPSTQRLEEAGLPIGEPRVNERAEVLEDRRRLLAGYVQHDGWDWDEVESSTARSDEQPIAAP